MKLLLIAVVLAIVAAPAHALQERDYQELWCTGESEHRLPDGARVDCIQNGYAIEVDYAYKWAESIGQALYYASQTGLKPGVLLIVGPSDHQFIERLFEAIQAGGVPVRVWFIRRQ